MYKIKQLPEDFIVKEVTNIIPNKGHYKLFWMTKTNLNTNQAVDFISKRLNISKKFIGFAGAKDKLAITTQLISIKCNKRVGKIKDISLEPFGDYNQKLALGDLKGNNFEITLRNLDSRINLTKTKFINTFGDQRFSKNNVEIGKLILQKKFKEAINLILESDGYYEKKINSYINKNKTDFIGALRLLDKVTLKMFIHAYQSKIWNDCSEINKNLTLPLVGFGTHFQDNEIEKLILQKLDKDKLTLRSFVIQSIPYLSSEGDVRDLYIETKIEEVSFEDDEINKGKKKQIIKFYLPKGSYATEVIKQLFS